MAAAEDAALVILEGGPIGASSLDGLPLHGSRNFQLVDADGFGGHGRLSFFVA
jgi:hypothetical protein